MMIQKSIYLRLFPKDPQKPTLTKKWRWWRFNSEVICTAVTLRILPLMILLASTFLFSGESFSTNFFNGVLWFIPDGHPVKSTSDSSGQSLTNFSLINCWTSFCSLLTVFIWWVLFSLTPSIFALLFSSDGGTWANDMHRPFVSWERSSDNGSTREVAGLRPLFLTIRTWTIPFRQRLVRPWLTFQLFDCVLFRSWKPPDILVL